MENFFTYWLTVIFSIMTLLSGNVAYFFDAWSFLNGNITLFLVNLNGWHIKLFFFFGYFIRLYQLLRLLSIKADERLLMNREMWSTKAKEVMANHGKSLEGSQENHRKPQTWQSRTQWRFEPDSSKQNIKVWSHSHKILLYGFFLFHSHTHCQMKTFWGPCM